MQLVAHGPLEPRILVRVQAPEPSIYAYDGDNLIESVNATGGVMARYAQGQNIDEPLAESTAGATSYYEADGLGSVTSLSSSAGALVDTYTYDSFGKETASSGSATLYILGSTFASNRQSESE